MTKTIRKKVAKSKTNGMLNASHGVAYKKVRQNESGDSRDMFDEEDEELEPANEKSDEEGSPNNTDDTVRMYLMQMGQIPLLSRVEEVDAAKEIERARALYRHSMLATDYVLEGAVAALDKVRKGELRLDRTIEGSVTHTTE